MGCFMAVGVLKGNWKNGENEIGMRPEEAWQLHDTLYSMMYSGIVLYWL